MSSDQTPTYIEIGYAVLCRYRHPEDWQEQYERIQGKGRIHCGYFLLVNELNPEQVGQGNAYIARLAVELWAQSVDLPVAAFYTTNFLPPDVGYPPRIVVPVANWERVLDVLQGLPKPQQ